MSVIPSGIVNQIAEKATEGLVLALASREDGAVMRVKWCNQMFCRITGYSRTEVVGQRGTVLIGKNVAQGDHLQIIENLMDWRDFSIVVENNRRDGTTYLQRMSWTHLSDETSGARWWLCSISQAQDQPALRLECRSVGDGIQSGGSTHQMLKVIKRLESENKRLHELAREVVNDANIDSVTGLANRRHFEIEVRAWINALESDSSEFAVLYIDIDHFKLVNDTLGHHAGDSLLKAVSEVLIDLTDDHDFVARVGGDEFVILTPLSESALNISKLADNLIDKLNTTFTYEGKSVPFSVSVGVAIAYTSINEPDQVVKDADAALYHAKSTGKARWSFFTKEMHEASAEDQALANDLLFACERREFLPFFQPIVSSSTGEVLGAEVLLRWCHSDRGVLLPKRFLRTATRFGLLKRIEECMFDALVNAVKELDRSGLILPSVSINVSSARLSDSSLVHAIRSCSISPKRFTVEILESIYIDQVDDRIKTNVDELRKSGATIAIDDFGTGHASIKGLLEIRPSIIKIDRSFIQPIVTDASSQAVVSSIVGIGKSLGMKVVAEGIETHEHAEIARRIGCDALQGFHYSMPKSVNDFRRWNEDLDYNHQPMQTAPHSK